MSSPKGLMGLRQRFFPVSRVAVDLGTANTLVYVEGQGIVLNEPSVVTVGHESGRVESIGLDAKRMLGRTPQRITAVRPLRDGVIADVDVTELMLRHFLRKAMANRFLKIRPQVIVGATGPKHTQPKHLSLIHISEPTRPY